jgi:hypothetical protein
LEKGISGKEKVMRSLRIILIIFLFASVTEISIADPVVWTSGNYEITSSNEWSWIPELHTYNNVTVTMTGGGKSVLYV